MNACSTVAPVEVMAAAEFGNALPPRSPSGTMRIFSSAHVSSSRRCPSSAAPRQLIKVGPAKGLDRKQVPPPAARGHEFAAEVTVSQPPHQVK
jgi:hypothetical protein